MTAAFIPVAPTRVRYTMILATTSVAVMLYLDRVCLSIVGEQIKADQNISPEQYANLLSSFFWAYALFQLPAGWLGDRFGTRYTLAAYLFLWSFCTGLMGAVSGFAALFALRLGCGIFEAGAYPLAAVVVNRWIPISARGKASGIVAVGGRIGGAVAPLLTVALAAGAVDGWRRPFLIYGGVGMAGAIAFYVWFRDRPTEHPSVNQAERDLISDGIEIVRKPIGYPPMAELIKCRVLWLNSLVQFLTNFAWVFIITLFPTYLAEVFQTPQESRAFYQSLPLHAGIFGMLIGGWITDSFVRRFGLKWARALPITVGRLTVATAYFGCLLVNDPFAVTLLLCVVALATDAGTAATWALGQDIGGQHVGAVVGFANMWGNVGAAVSPQVFQLLRASASSDPAVGWNYSFLLCAVTQIIAAVAALGLDARTTIVKRPIETQIFD